MLELFSPFYLWRVNSYEPGLLGMYIQYSVWLVLATALVEALVKSGEQFVARVKGLSLLWFQISTWIRLFLTYIICALVINLALSLLFQTQMATMDLISILGLAILPRVYVVYGLIPYLGRTFRRLLDLWTLALLYLALQLGMDMETWKVWVLWACGLATYIVLHWGFEAILSSRNSVLEAVET